MQKIQAQAVPSWSIANAQTWSSDAKLPTLPNSKLDNNQQAALKDFLSLYAVTRDDSVTLPGATAPSAVAGSRGSLALVNGGAQKELVRNALFGDGTKANGLISEVLIGEPGHNTYENIRQVLSNLDIKNKPVAPHKDHFHIYLKPPKIQGIVSSQNLETGAMPTLLTLDQPTADVATLTHAVQTMLNQIGSASSEEEGIMFTVDIPYEPSRDLATPYLMVSATQGKDKSPIPPKELKREFCQDVESADGTSSYNDIALLHFVLYKLGYKIPKNKSEYNAPADVMASVLNSKVTIEPPKHGVVTRPLPASLFWQYKPEKGYEGPDKVVFTIEVLGRRYKVIVNLLVHSSVDEYAKTPPCDAFFRKQMKKADLIDEQPTYAAGWSPSLRSDFSQIAYNFTNLPGTAVGETVGAGSSATITLDTNAAGHGWFIDATPGNNSEYLPTSDANVWIAKAGSGHKWGQTPLTKLNNGV